MVDHIGLLQMNDGAGVAQEGRAALGGLFQFALDDLAIEGAQTFSLTLVKGAEELGTVTVTTPAAVVTILDNDGTGGADSSDPQCTDGYDNSESR